jgi:hypothetical protein
MQGRALINSQSWMPVPCARPGHALASYLIQNADAGRPQACVYQQRLLTQSFKRPLAAGISNCCAGPCGDRRSLDRKGALAAML